MLRQLSIRDVVLIDRLELEFEPGLGSEPIFTVYGMSESSGAVGRTGRAAG